MSPRTSANVGASDASSSDAPRVRRRVMAGAIAGYVAINLSALAAAVELGIQPLLAFIALISINLAVVNLLPIPVLDGGAFLFLLVEGIIRRPLPTRVREVLSMVGLAMIVLLMVVAFKNDILRLFRG